MNRMFGRRATPVVAVSLPGGRLSVQAATSTTAAATHRNWPSSRNCRIDRPRIRIWMRILAACRGLCVLHEHVVGVEQEHEAAKWPLDRAGTDAQESITRGMRTFEQRIEAANLELKLRRAYVLNAPAKRF